MAIFTNKELHDKILSSQEYRKIADNRNNKQGEWIPFLGSTSMTWSGWFKKYPTVNIFVNMNIPNNDNIIDLKTFKLLSDIPYIQGGKKDSTLSPLIALIEKELDAKSMNAISVTGQLLDWKNFKWKNKRDLFTNICNFFNQIVNGTFSGYSDVKKCKTEMVNLFTTVLDKLDTYASDNDTLFLLKRALELGEEKTKDKSYGEFMKKFVDICPNYDRIAKM